jgi:hypothetical protein
MTKTATRSQKNSPPGRQETPKKSIKYLVFLLALTSVICRALSTSMNIR